MLVTYVRLMWAIADFFLLNEGIIDVLVGVKNICVYPLVVVIMSKLFTSQSIIDVALYLFVASLSPFERNDGFRKWTLE
jgi:hypothetical protein